MMFKRLFPNIGDRVEKVHIGYRPSHLICKECGSIDVRVLVESHWDYSKSEWVNERVHYDNARCRWCNKDVQLIWTNDPLRARNIPDARIMIIEEIKKYYDIFVKDDETHSKRIEFPWGKVLACVGWVVDGKGFDVWINGQVYGRSFQYYDFIKAL